MSARKAEVLVTATSRGEARTVASGKRGVAYGRISEDKEGAGLGAERQVEDCRLLAAAHGIDVVDILVDNDLSAYRGRCRRPGYQELLAGMHQGRWDVVLAWHTDRIHRWPRELEDFIDAQEARNLDVLTVRAGRIDLATPAGRAVARTLCAWANYESEHKGERIRRKHREIAESGRHHGGGTRGFGYAPADGRLVLVEEEAAVVRDAAARLLDGVSLRRVCLQMNAAGHRTTGRNLWTPRGLKRLLLAWRVYGAVAHPEVGVVKAEWEPILPLRVRERIRTLLEDPSRSTPGRPRRHLLSGLVLCGKCGKRMYAAGGSGGRLIVYACPAPPLGCNGTAVSAAPLEAAMTEGVLGVIAGDLPLPFRSPVCDDDADTAAIRADREMLEELAAEYGSRGITMEEWRVARLPVEQRIAAASERQAKRARILPLRRLMATGRTLADQWPELDEERRREIMALVIERIVVRPVGRCGNRFDAAKRLDVTWRA